MISLITQTERRAVQGLQFCYLCGRSFEIGDSKNRDHVPPDSIFKVDHKDPLILPTHESCNSAHAVIDEKIAQLIALRYGKAPADPQRRRLIVDPKIGAITNLDIDEAVWYWIAGYETEEQSYQQCLSSAEGAEEQQAATSATSACNVQHGPESFFNTQTNRCECASGYAPSASNPFSCISMQAFCTDTVGNGAIPATNTYTDGAAYSVNCTCGVGYNWNGNKSQCVAIPATSTSSFNPAQFDATPVAPSASAQLNPDGTMPNPFGTSTVPDPSFSVSVPSVTPTPHVNTTEVKTGSTPTLSGKSSALATNTRTTSSVVISSAATSTVATSTAAATQSFFTVTGNFFGQLFGKLFSFF